MLAITHESRRRYPLAGSNFMEGLRFFFDGIDGFDMIDPVDPVDHVD